MNMDKKRLLAASAAILLSLALVGCGGGGSGSGGGESTGGGGDQDESAAGPISALWLALDGAEGLVVTGDNGLTMAAAAIDPQHFDADDYVVNPQDAVGLEPNSLYKATLDGRLEQVTWTAADGEAIPPGTIIPRVVTELSDRFVAIGFEQDIEGGETLRLPFLAEKSTGFAYSEDPETEGPLYANTFESPGKITTDRQGNIYLEGPVSGSGGRYDGIYRIDVSAVGTGKNVEATLITGDDRWIYSFWEVPYHGRFIAYGGSNAEGVPVDRLRRTDAAGFDNSEIELSNRLILGADGEVYAFYMGDLFQDEPSKIYHLDLDVSGSSVTAVLEDMVPPEGAPEILVPFNGDRRVVAGRLIVPDGLDSTPYEVRPRQGYSRPVLELDGIFQDIRHFSATDRFLFFFADTTEDAPGGEADGVIIRWDGSTGQVDRLELPAQFELREFEVLSDSRVWVRAVERATDSTVIGEVSVSGDFTETARVPGTRQVLTLTPINPAQFIVIDGRAQDWAEERLIAIDDGGIDALGAIADRGTLNMLVRTEDVPADGVRIEVSDGSVVHTIVYEATQGVFEYTNSMGMGPIHAEDDGWLGASGPDGFELAMPLDTLTVGSTSITVKAELAKVFDDEDPVIVEPTGPVLGPATYTLP